jgi:hypothetical protein
MMAMVETTADRMWPATILSSIERGRTRVETLRNCYHISRISTNAFVRIQRKFHIIGGKKNEISVQICSKSIFTNESL